MPLSVTLINYSGTPEKIISAAAKLCYSSSGAKDVLEGLTPEKTESFIDMLSAIGHESPIEHASFTFAIEGVSRSLLAQLTRHRLASYSVKSQRYVKEGQFEYVTPPEIENLPEAKKLYIKAMEEDQRVYNELTDILMKKHMDKLLADGLDEKQAKKSAEKMAIEDARFVLPNACETKLIMTINARSLMNFFHHRCCNRAQWEIRDLATKMLALVREVCPTLFKNAGPSCLCGACPEGKMTCGKIKEVREKFKM